MQRSHLISPRSARPRPTVAYGRGSYLYDTDGHRYLDGCSGSIAANIGYGVPEVLDAMRRQAQEITFCYRTQFTSRPAEDLARRLADVMPGDLDDVFFVNSGSEATETAARLALQYWRAQARPDKRWIVSRRVSYHGMTLGALSMSGHSERRRSSEGLLHGFPDVPAAYCYRCPLGRQPDSCDLACATAWEDALDRLGADTVAAAIVEPVVGAAGGALPAPPGYLRRLREICDRRGILLIFDEVMTGLGRTGSWLAGDEDGVIADLVALGKGLSAGYAPVAAVVARRPIVRTIAGADDPGSFGHTFSGNPLGAATCLAVLDYLQDHDLVTAARERGAELRNGLERLAARHPIVGDVRGRGLLLGVELVADRVTRRRFPQGAEVVQRLVDVAFGHGLLVYPATLPEGGDSILVAPPLTVSSDEIAELLSLFDAALDDLEHHLAPGADLAGAPDPSGPTSDLESPDA